MMNIPDCIAWLLQDDVSTVNIYCDNTVKNEVKEFFAKTFDNEWNLACVEAIKKYGSIISDDDELISEENIQRDKNLIPYHSVSASVFEDRVQIKIGLLSIRYEHYGDWDDFSFGTEALENALKCTKEKYPDIEYQGYIMFDYSDSKCGEIEQYAISSTDDKEKEKRFADEALGRGLRRLLSDNGYVCHIGYFLIDNYKYNGEKEPFEEAIDFLYAYEKWIGKDELLKAFNIILDQTIEVYPDLNEYLVDYIQKKKVDM